MEHTQLMETHMAGLFCGCKEAGDNSRQEHALNTCVGAGLPFPGFVCGLTLRSLMGSLLSLFPFYSCGN